jgi:hypothetical protein
VSKGKLVMLAVAVMLAAGVAYAVAQQSGQLPQVPTTVRVEYPERFRIVETQSGTSDWHNTFLLDSQTGQTWCFIGPVEAAQTKRMMGWWSLGVQGTVGPVP